MNILVAVNEAFLMPLSIMLYSLLCNNDTVINVYVLHFKIPKKKQRVFINQMSELNENRNKKNLIGINFIKCEEVIFAGLKTSERYRNETNLRLLMLRYLPDTLERVLWLDADIIVNGNIVEFYNYPDKGQYAAVCEDQASRSHKRELIRLLELGSKKYFNAGVILFYLNNIRRNFTDDYFLRWMYNNQNKLQYPDQNTLNVCFGGMVTWCNPKKYNLQLLYAVEDSEVKKAIIIHYNTKIKPWMDEYVGPGEGLYWRYACKIYGVLPTVMHFIKNYIKFEPRK